LSPTPSSSDTVRWSPEQRADTLTVEIRRRILLALDLNEHAVDRAAMLAHYANAPLDWIADWAWTYDPRIRKPLPKRQPLMLWEKQRDLVTWTLERIRVGENGLLKKARDVGASWVFCAIAAWMFLFEPETAITFGSRKQELVDKKGDPKALFSKIRDLLDALPVWMLPHGYSRTEHDNYLRLVNPANGSTVTGEAGDNMGRGGRSTVYFLDEFAFVPRASSVDAAVNDNAGSVVYLSTSNGVGTLFHQKEQSGHLPLFYFFWRDDPRKDDAWKAQKLLDIGPTAFAREHEGDDGAALDNIMIPPPWVMAAVDLELSDSGERVAGLDVADQGEDSNVLVTRSGPVTRHIEDWGKVLPIKTARKTLRLCAERSVERLAYDRAGPGASVAGQAAERPTPFVVEGVLAGASPTHVCYDDSPDKPARERFANWGTEAWWALRRRFEKTYEHTTGVAEYPEDELISIPYHDKLIAQLSSRKFEETEAGKIRAESKKKMRARGVKSPDFADALAYCYAPTGMRISRISASIGGGRRL